MKRKSLKKEICPLARALDVIGEWWSFLILREAFNGAQRFEDFQSNLDIPRNTLTQRLAKLVKCGVLEKRPIAQAGRRQEYVLSAMGRELLPVLMTIREWGVRHLFNAGETPIRLIDGRDGSAVSLQIKIVSAAGKSVPPNDLQLVAPQKKK